MDARQMFKAAYIARCIEQGLTTPAEINAHVKAALDKQAGWGSDLTSAGALGGALLLAAPPIIGGIGGSLAARATNNLDDYSADEAKKQELIDEYKRQALRARQQGLARRATAAALPAHSYYR